MKILFVTDLVAGRTSSTNAVQTWRESGLLTISGGQGLIKSKGPEILAQNAARCVSFVHDADPSWMCVVELRSTRLGSTKQVLLDVSLPRLGGPRYTLVVLT